MAIAKIEFTPLSASKFTYTAFGGIRFYDVDGNVIDTLGNGPITDTNTTFETDKIKATVTNTYGSAYKIGYAVRTDWPQTGNYPNHYWLSSYDNQIITVEFKTPISALSKIEFVPTPDSGYSNRGVDIDFQINVYDENNDLIISYNVNPIIDQGRNYIQTLNTPELTYKKKILFSDGTNVYRYDSTTSSFVLVTDNASTLTSDDFLDFGSNTPLNINKSILSNIGNNIKILAYTDKTGVNSSVVNIKVIPYKQLIKSNHPIKLDGYNTINSIVFNTIGTGEIKVVLSRDNVNWYTWDGTQWMNISSTGLDINNKTDVDNVYNNGIDYSTLNTLTWNEYKQLYSDVLDNLYLAFVINYNTNTDDIKIDNITINVNPKPFYTDITNNCVISQGYSIINVTINDTGDFIINYQD